MFLKYFLMLNVVSIFAPAVMRPKLPKFVAKHRKIKFIESYSEITRTAQFYDFVIKNGVISLISKKTGLEAAKIRLGSRGVLSVESENEANKALFPTHEIKSWSLYSVDDEQDRLILTLINGSPIHIPVLRASK